MAGSNQRGTTDRCAPLRREWLHERLALSLSPGAGGCQAMNLLIISGMPHYMRNGQVVGWGPTALEIDHLATVTDTIRHIAPLYPGAPPLSAIPYRSSS